MKTAKSYIKQFLYGPVFYNYLFIVFQLAYNYIFREWLLTGTMKTLYESRTSPLHGITILLAFIAGTYGVMMTCRILRTTGARKPVGVAYGICVLGWVLSIHLLFTALQSFGIKVSGDFDKLGGMEQTLVTIAILTVMIQSAFMAGFIARLDVPYEKPVSRAKRIATDISSFYYACVSYTVMWETIMYGSVAANGRYDILTLYGLFNVAGWTFLFLLFYPPIRFPYLLRELHDTDDNAGNTMILVSYVLVLVTGIMPLVRIG